MKKSTSVKLAAILLALSLGLPACSQQLPDSPTEQASPEASASTNVAETSNPEETAESSNPEETSESIELSFWNNFTATDGEVLAEIIEEFNQTNDKGISITMDVMPEKNLPDKLPLARASKTAPDFFAVGDAFFASFVSNGTVNDLSSFFDHEGVDKADIKEGALVTTQVNGAQYFLPMTITGHYLYWNKDLFAAAGLDPETPPKTWEEVEQMAVAVSAIGDDIYGIGFPVGAQFAYHAFSNWALAYGGKVFNADQTESVLNSSENLQSLQRVQALVRDKKVSPEAPKASDINDLMNAGRIGMQLNGPWGNGNLRGNGINYGVTVLPHADGKEPTAYAGGVGFAIPTTTDASRIAAIYEFFKYWYDTDVHAEWTSACIATPFVISTTEKEEIKNDPILSIMSSQVAYSEPFLPGNPNSVNIVLEILSPMLEAVQLGEDPAAALETADQALRNIS
ncbi:MAG: ABC transporter substrate-binding protein [Clostridiales bacterium]|nr:ABC transporter substrate-binding protein [Clostridiales bacterium]